MAKIILTKSQNDFLLEEEKLYNFLSNNLNESVDITNLKKKIKRALAVGATLAVIITAITELKINYDIKKNLIEFAKYQSAMDSIYNQKVRACEEYMNYALQNQGYTMNDTGLKPETLVSASLKQSFDLPFLMAVAHAESCFGANNRAKRTNSVFSVGAYDNGVDAVSYDDPNDSVDSYLRLLLNHYLINGKSINDLMTPGGFVNKIGKRYAKDPNYEKKIKNIRDRIIRMYPELS